MTWRRHIDIYEDLWKAELYLFELVVVFFELVVDGFFVVLVMVDFFVLVDVTFLVLVLVGFLLLVVVGFLVLVVVSLLLLVVAGFWTVAGLIDVLVFFVLVVEVFLDVVTGFVLVVVVFFDVVETFLEVEVVEIFLLVVEEGFVMAHWHKLVKADAVYFLNGDVVLG